MAPRAFRQGSCGTGDAGEQGVSRDGTRAGDVCDGVRGKSKKALGEPRA
jgi:hypothetical protein